MVQQHWMRKAHHGRSALPDATLWRYMAYLFLAGLIIVTVALWWESVVVCR